jgi:hypothetical protein
MRTKLACALLAASFVVAVASTGAPNGPRGHARNVKDPSKWPISHTVRALHTPRRFEA